MVCIPLGLFSCHLLTVSKPNNSHHGRLAPYHDFSSTFMWEQEQTFYVPDIPIFSDTLALADATSGGASVLQHNIDNDCQARLYENSAAFNQDTHFLVTVTDYLIPSFGLSFIICLTLIRSFLISICLPFIYMVREYIRTLILDIWMRLCEV